MFSQSNDSPNCCMIYRNLSISQTLWVISEKNNFQIDILINLETCYIRLWKFAL